MLQVTGAPGADEEVHLQFDRLTKPERSLHWLGH